MSNIAGKSYAMNVITPITGWVYYLNRLKFAAVQFSVSRRLGKVGFLGKLVPLSLTNLIFERLDGLLTLSLIHYARWAIITEFPHLDSRQPRENLKYHYMFFFSNFNGANLSVLSLESKKRSQEVGKIKYFKNQFICKKTC